LIILKIVSATSGIGGAIVPPPGYVPVSSEISDFTPCAHAQSNIIHIKYVEKTDD